MTGFDDKYSIGDLNLQSTHDLPTSKLWWAQESKVSSRWINFCGWIYTTYDLFDALSKPPKSVNPNNQNISNTKE